MWCLFTLNYNYWDTDSHTEGCCWLKWLSFLLYVIMAGQNLLLVQSGEHCKIMGTDRTIAKYLDTPPCGDLTQTKHRKQKLAIQFPSFLIWCQKWKCCFLLRHRLSRQHQFQQPSDYCNQWEGFPVPVLRSCTLYFIFWSSGRPGLHLLSQIFCNLAALDSLKSRKRSTLLEPSQIRRLAMIAYAITYLCSTVTGAELFSTCLLFFFLIFQLCNWLVAR